MPVLGFRLDRVEDFATTAELGDKLGLDTSPVTALAATAGNEPSLLVIDQLDAVSLTSGRMPNSFDAVADLVYEAAAFPNMRVVLACRQFDVDNDYRIRSFSNAIKAESIAVATLTDAEINSAVSAMGLDASKLQAVQREILRVPLHLVLLSNVAGEADALSFQTTAHLFDAYWKRKLQAVRDRKAGTRFRDVISVVATAISDNQRLSVSDTVLDGDDLADDANVLISEHVLVRDGDQVAFFHEAFFDYAFAREWATKHESLVTFLTASEQELFRRAQVRQIMQHLRQREPDRFVTEVGAALSSPRVRFHIKETIVAVLSGLPDPTSDELRMVVAAAETDSALASRAWNRLRTPPWFDRLDSDGLLNTWLEHDSQELRGRALDALGMEARTNPDRVAAILATHLDNAEYQAWLRWVVRFADLHESRALFDLFLDAVRDNAFVGYDHDLWLYPHHLADHKPGWAIELFRAYFVERAGALTLNDDGKVVALTGREFTAAGTHGEGRIRTACGIRGGVAAVHEGRHAPHRIEDSDGRALT